MRTRAQNKPSLLLAEKATTRPHLVIFPDADFPRGIHRLCNYFVDNLSVHIGQSEISATVAEGEFLVI